MNFLIYYYNEKRAIYVFIVCMSSKNRRRKITNTKFSNVKYLL